MSKYINIFVGILVILSLFFLFMSYYNLRSDSELCLNDPFLYGIKLFNTEIQCSCWAYEGNFQPINFNSTGYLVSEPDLSLSQNISHLNFSSIFEHKSE